MATKPAECITDGKEIEERNEVGIGNSHPELCEDNEITVADCKSRQSVSVK